MPAGVASGGRWREIGSVVSAFDLWHTRCIMARSFVHHHIRLGRQGRVVLPAEVRRRLELEEGQVLLLREEEGRIVLETREAALRRLREPFASIPPGVSLAGELIAERRREAAAEGGAEEEGGTDVGG